MSAETETRDRKPTSTAVRPNPGLVCAGFVRRCLDHIIWDPTVLHSQCFRTFCDTNTHTLQLFLWHLSIYFYDIYLFIYLYWRMFHSDYRIVVNTMRRNCAWTCSRCCLTASPCWKHHQATVYCTVITVRNAHKEVCNIQTTTHTHAGTK